MELCPKFCTSKFGHGTSTVAECDKQATVVGLLITLGDDGRGHVSSTADRRPSPVDILSIQRWSTDVRIRVARVRLHYLILVSRVDMVNIIERKRVFLQACRLAHQSLCLEGVPAKRLIGSGCRFGWSTDGCIKWGGDRRRKGAVFGVNVGHPIVTNGILCVRGGDAALPKLLWDFLFY